MTELKEEEEEKVEEKVEEVKHDLSTTPSSHDELFQ